MPAARSLLPFVRMSYAQPSSYQWIDAGGEARSVTQEEGEEQGGPSHAALVLHRDPGCA